MAETVSKTALQTTRPAAANIVSADQRMRTMAGNLMQRLQAMSPRQRTWLVAAVLMIVGISGGMLWMASRPDMKVLFSGLESRDAQQISQQLAAAGIPYDIAADGSLRVPSDQIDKARMQIAAKGMPQSGRMGFELFDKPNWVGSEFDEKVNYQRALEGELERTIITISAVRSARVHLVLPQQSLFASEERDAKASVVLQLKKSSLPPEQIESIRNLVAGAVENLHPEQVTLVDADGRINLSAPTQHGTHTGAEQQMEDKLVAMLEPLAGQNNVRATVNVSYDEGSEEQSDDVYDPTKVATVSMQRSEHTMTPQQRTAGVPGTVSNSPAAAPSGSAQAAASALATAKSAPAAASAQSASSAVLPPLYPQAMQQGETVREESGSYAVSHHTSHTQQGPEHIRRVTTAVVVNDRASVENAGKVEQTVWKPRSADEMKRLEQLAQAAVGFDLARGDQVIVENIGFSTNVPEAKPAALDRVMEQAGSLARSGAAHTLMIAACGLVLVFMVVRPLTKQVSVALMQPALLTASSAGTAQAGRQSASVNAIQPSKENASRNYLLDRKPAGQNEDFNTQLHREQKTDHAQGVFDHVTDHIRREPLESKRLLENWISTHHAEGEI